MARFFNTTGPCEPAEHFMLPRKTTFLMSWMKSINAADQALACYVSLERCREFSEAEPASLLSRTMIDWAKLVAPKPLVGMRDPRDYLIQSKDGVTIDPWSALVRELAGGDNVMVFGG